MAITLFYSALAGLVLLFGWKAFEIKVRRIEAVSKRLELADAKIHGWMYSVVYAYNHSKKIGRVFFSEFLPAYAYEILTKLKDRVSKKYYSMGDSFRGRRVLRADGSVSFFLQKITEERNAK